MFNPKELIYTIPAILIAISFHELAHGYVAHKLGDPTPKNTGRLSLNPMAHLDPLGTISLLLFGFGWAKPVRVNPYYFENRKKGMAMVSAAGPLTNFVIAFLSIFCLGIMFKFSLGEGVVSNYILMFLSILASINIGLGVFNLIPIPPLDGSKLLGIILPEDTYFKFQQYDNYFQFAMLFLLYFGFLTPILSYFRGSITSGMLGVVSLLLGV